MLRIYDKHLREVAVHLISLSQGEFITNKIYNPKLERFLSRPYEYEEDMREIGKDVKDFFFKLKSLKPNSYHRIISGILHL
ncbi:hypothetical protein TDSAC_0842 [Thermodesulfobium acidiphilum]|uniref:Uncharacterized protein n=1 Tax=Thermodesulfobium acidiphilum TaxID=1794699 RepID=A0A2R4W065_THEAF|nr:hypothetical protein [Thermodesulfobium acidiphilum]AWB10199.1 hypothetical protein TDSAC_0842 [Thermodesulfobium acidiphilum]